VRKSAEVFDDLRQGGCDDGLIQGGEQEAGENSHQNPDDSSARDTPGAAGKSG